MKKLFIIAFISAVAMSAQWTTFSTQAPASSNLSGAMDSKINWQTSSSACAGLNGTVGKDLCIDTGTLKIYKVTVTGTPATWADIAATAGTAAALASTPSLCSAGQAPTGVLPNGNATGCAVIGGGGSAVCKAVFATVGSTVSSLTHSGCITAVTYLSTGRYTLTLSSPPASAVMTCTAGDTGVATAICMSGDSTVPMSSTTTEIDVAGLSGLIDPRFVYVVIQ